MPDVLRSVAEWSLLGALLCLSLPLPIHIHLAALGLGCGILLLLAPRPADRVWPVPVLLSTLAFGGLTLLSVAFASDPERALLSSLGMLPAVLLCHTIAIGLDQRGLRRLALTLTAMAIVAAGRFLWVAVTHPGEHPTVWMDQAGYVQFSIPNDLLFLCLLSPFCLHWLCSECRFRIKLIGMMAFLTVIACIVVYQSRGGLLLVLGAFFFLMLQNRPKRMLPGLVLLVLAAVAADVAAGFPLSAKFFDPVSWSTRLPPWLVAWRMFLDAPWLGQGPGGFSLGYEHYLAALELPAWVILDSRHIPWAHNLYLELLSERGLLGFIAFGAFALSTLKSLRRVTERTANSVRPPLLGAVFGSLGLALAGGLFELSLLRYWFLILLSIPIGIQMAYSRQDEESTHA